MQNYNQYRGELELYDPSYCSLSYADCFTLTNDVVNGASATIYPIDAADLADKPDDMKVISSNDLWFNQHEALQTIRYSNLPPSNFLHHCDSSDLCIRCKPASEALAAAGFPMTSANMNGGVNMSDITEVVASVKNWTEALFNVTKKDIGLVKSLAKCENVLMRMAGGKPGVAAWWSQFPNPATACNDNAQGINFEMRSGSGADSYTDPWSGETVNVKVKGVYSNKEYNDTQKCANYLLSMLEGNAATGVAGCPSDATCRLKVRENFEAVYKYMNSSRVGFCRYPDAACKDKVKFYVSKEFQTLGIVGVIIIVFQLGVIFCTYFGIIDYGVLCLCGGDDDDDEFENPVAEDEDDDDDDDDDE